MNPISVQSSYLNHNVRNVCWIRPDAKVFTGYERFFACSSNNDTNSGIIFYGIKTNNSNTDNLSEEIGFLPTSDIFNFKGKDGLTNGAMNGEITQLLSVSNSKLIVGLSTGVVASVELLHQQYTISSPQPHSLSALSIMQAAIENQDQLHCIHTKVTHVWDNLYSSDVSVTALRVYNNHIVVGGSNGVLYVVDMSSDEVVCKVINDTALDLSLTTPNTYAQPYDCGYPVSALSVCGSSVYVGSVGGIVTHVDLHDAIAQYNTQHTPTVIRTNVIIDLLSEDVTCVVAHPTQPHCFLVGGSNGNVSLFNHKIQPSPLAVIALHDSAVDAMTVLSWNTNLLISASNNGTIVECNFAAIDWKNADVDHTKLHTFNIASYVHALSCVDADSTSKHVLVGGYHHLVHFCVPHSASAHNYAFAQ